MTIAYRKGRGANGLLTITAFNPEADEPLRTISENHPSFEAIRSGLEQGDDSVWDLFNMAQGIMKRFRQITDRVSWDGHNILWDGDPVHSTLSEQLRRALESGEQNYEALALFWEKLESNPEPHSRTQAYDWLASHEFKITPEGDVVGYKGVYANGDGTYRSSARSGSSDRPSAFVDGVAVEPRSTVPNNLGTEVSLPRSEVSHDPRSACSRGLHVGTFSYASDYGDTVAQVTFNPRDLVSVPTDASGEKVRVHRYKVVSVVESEAAGKSPVLSGAASGWAGDVGYAAP